MQLLILGATGLSGTAITELALERGHDVVAVHRGVSDTMRDVDDERLVDYVHDRSEGHRALAARGPFDAIIDVSARLPAWVADAVRSLDEEQPRWVQLSSVSAYADLSKVGVSEADPVAAFDDAALELRACTDPKAPLAEIPYGPAKAACERMLLERADRWQRATVFRPVLITGAHDTTWRAPWWVRRIAQGGTTVAPPAEDPIQVIDARDVALLALGAAERGVPGVFNAAPAPGSQTVGSLVAACREVVAAAGLEPAAVVHVPRDVLEAQGAEPWQDLPAWLPPDSAFAGMVTANTDELQEHFAFEARPLRDTMSWVFDWTRTANAGAPDGGLDSNLEQRILAAC